jgi:hypothetical protein
MQNKVYVITCEGVYRQEILGIYEDRASAIREARAAILLEKDGYHDIMVSSCDLNKIVEDATPIFSIIRLDGGKGEIKTQEHFD